MSIFKVFATFYHYLLKNKPLFGFFLLLVIISNIAMNLNPYFYQLFVKAIPSLDQNYLINLLFIFIGTRFLGVITDIFAFYVGDSILFEAAKNARIDIFKHVQNLDFSFHTNKSTGSLISAFKRGDGAFFSFFHDVHVRMFGVLIGFLVMVYFLLNLNPLIVVLTTASLIITIIAAKFLVANNVAKRKIFNHEEDAISGIITDNLINFETVKLFAKEKWENKRLTKSFIPWKRALWGYGNSFRLIDAVMGTLISLSIFLVLYLTINQAIDLNLTVPDFVLITGFLSAFYPKLWDLVWSTRDLAKNYADIEKYFGLLEYKEEVLDPIKPKLLKSLKGVIEFKNVSHSYLGGTKNAIKKLNLTIKAGESVAFVGRSGSGKTTITKLLMRFFDPTGGEITIDGIDIKDFLKTDLRSFFGVVPQEAVLFNNTIGYNIAYGGTSQRILQGRNLKGLSAEVPTLIEASRMAHLSDFIEKLPQKYETNVGERGIKLSGGQKQRLAIARMIMSNPDIIIFDEATSHLDSESEKLIQDAFWNYAKNKTTIVIAHRLSTIAKADRIIVMDDGKIIEEGSHKDLVENKNGLYKHLWNLQS
ncbi:MAG: ABC transporter transmembrane region [Candidatus Woesebacteria bacterium GW2011_GWA1_33_30]|uniref:ABC transporter transmembrane region n=1 Tax=Candidatus Woesebacteria bacterium GW2011_GWA2_33_28 TaxID=1618561 RepID=A0A0G0C9R7_9BACT|nr:MAG: ABC transporter transmembrane region [Candidatus Woesebacteria bacterium GW2011_GWA2_33_28]KKP48713.1 MAG: ABC transporter transmembrane region [Candidatus Woesebacteria bacterium GW2011_GWA1_33_30]KKP49986.1 MAG: ABC transporter transmembrane region [Microgenomates group bacterium GW2011_GWC1_33_32]KKP51757.1 MAG: ABC transporter transmembrane region [Candidatus Woesebacteria bacterium GW2011_GWB1_33_38]KKP56782.1 MAG: ABC transporter transmembrane region [Microgenomates group bacteriu